MMTNRIWPASIKQINFIRTLLNDKDVSESVYESTKDLYDDLERGSLDSKSASEFIGKLVVLPKKPKEIVQFVTEDGIYLDRENYIVYKVQYNRASGDGRRLYAKILIVDAESQTGRFEYSPGALKLIKPEWKMTLEEAKLFGSLYGVCCNCGRTLTDENSIAEGIGPICAAKFELG